MDSSLNLLSTGKYSANKLSQLIARSPTGQLDSDGKLTIQLSLDKNKKKLMLEVGSPSITGVVRSMRIQSLN